MVDYRKLRELVKLMTENDLSELELRDQAETVVIKRGGAAHGVVMGPPMMHHAPMTVAAPASGTAGAGGDAPAADDDADLIAIKSPMVGTFYTAPDPNSPAFVTPGSSVGPDSVVCIVEAMKVFSEIKAECSGKIERVLVKDREPVEYGQKLFLVRPS
jgi:acetyl-CoA carboxylase biotin carboxyl carrier protein